MARRNAQTRSASQSFRTDYVARVKMPAQSNWLELSQRNVTQRLQTFARDYLSQMQSGQVLRHWVDANQQQLENTDRQGL